MIMIMIDIEDRAVQQSISLPLSTVRTLKELAERDRVSISSIIRDALEPVLEKNRKE